MSQRLLSTHYMLGTLLSSLHQVFNFYDRPMECKYFQHSVARKTKAQSNATIEVAVLNYLPRFLSP